MPWTLAARVAGILDAEEADRLRESTGLYVANLGQPYKRLAPVANCRNCGAPPEPGACSYCTTPSDIPHPAMADAEYLFRQAEGMKALHRGEHVFGVASMRPEWAGGLK